MKTATLKRHKIICVVILIPGQALHPFAAYSFFNIVVWKEKMRYTIVCYRGKIMSIPKWVLPKMTLNPRQEPTHIFLQRFL